MSMDSADLVICKWWNNKAYCKDHWNGWFPGTPEDDAQDDVRIYYAEWSYKNYFEVGWKRLFNTTDDKNDEVLPYGSEIPMIWAYGEVDISTGEVLKHYGYGISKIVTPVVPGLSTWLITKSIFLLGLLI